MEMEKLRNLLQHIHMVVGSIRFRLTLWFVVILAMVMLAFSAFIYTRQLSYLRSDTLSRLEEKIHQIQSSSSLPRRDEPEGQLRIPDFSQDAGPLLQGNDILAVTDAQGVVVQIYGPISTTDVNRIASLTISQGNQGGSFSYTLVQGTASGSGKSQEYTFLVGPVSYGPIIVGYLILGSPVDPNGQLPRLILTLLLGGLGTMVIAQIGGFWLADRAMRPVKTITQAARQIGETDLSRRLNMGSRDELGQLADTFDDMLARLQAAFDRQRQFTADASHELRTPLTIVGLEAGRALEAPKGAQDYRQALGVIQSENEYMSRLVGNLLILSRMDAGQAKLQKEALDLSDLALEVIERLAAIASRNGVELVTGDLPEVPISGDRQYLSQMISNLVENGIKYVRSEHKCVQIETGILHEESEASKNGRGNHNHVQQVDFGWVRISDNGPGISQEHLPHLFDRFYQVDKARSRSMEDEENSSDQESTGTGLGLSIVQWIVNAHDGKVSVQSELGVGTVFEVRFPLLKGAQS
jgi:signal transduction histidine kinase